MKSCRTTGILFIAASVCFSLCEILNLTRNEPQNRAFYLIACGVSLAFGAYFLKKSRTAAKASSDGETQPEEKPEEKRDDAQE